MESDRPAFTTPGARVREARVARRMSLEDLAAETRIPETQLAALEADDYEHLSGPLYARSFLRACAQALDLDPQPLLDDLARLQDDADAAAPEEPLWETETEVRHVSAFPRHRLAWAFAVLVLALAVWGVTRLLPGRGGSDGTGTPPQPEANVAAERPAATADTTHATPLDSVAADSQLVAVRDTVQAPSGEAPDSLIASLAGRVVAPDAAELDRLDALPAGGPSLSFSGGRTWPLVLRVVMRERQALGVGVDDDTSAKQVSWPENPALGVPREGVVPGRIYAVGGRYVAYWGAFDHFLLRLAEAAGVTVTLNGRPLAISTRFVGREWVLDRSLLE